jgi:FKBP-type peptidyl-prolyl cis-trans isomerase
MEVRSWLPAIRRIRFAAMIKLGLILLAASLCMVACDGGVDGACARGEVETDSGLVYTDVVCGGGAEATGGSVTITYVAMLENGEEFASSDEQGGELVFALGRGQVITGLDEGVEGMREGGTRRLVIPPALAYDEAGLPPWVEPGATVIYEVTLEAVREPD